MRVLGVDPGLTRCGLGVVDGSAGAGISLVDVTVIRTGVHDDLGQRLRALDGAFKRWLGEHRPDAIAVERVFSQHNVSTVMGTAQAGAVAVLAAARAGVPVALHTPSEVKAAVTGSGSASKAQVAAMVRRLLGLGEPPAPADAADALALAICHLWRAPVQARQEAARQAVAKGRAATGQAAGGQAAMGQAALVGPARPGQAGPGQAGPGLAGPGQGRPVGGQR